jgi:hypothetical protein
MFVKRVFLFCLILNLSKGKCSEGCLKCNKEDDCMVCDTFNGYKFTGTNCEKVSVDNCLITNLSGECMGCKGDFFLDKTTLKCVKIDEIRKVDKCLSYDNKQNCSNCTGDFVMNNGVCIAVNNIIENCEVYNSNETCRSCKPNFILALTGKCKDAKKCLFYGEVFCNECKSGYIKNNNMFFSSFYNFDSSASKDILVSTINSYKKSYFDMKVYDNCHLQAIYNCVDYVSHDKCKTCADGHFLTTNGTCESYPLPIIAHCIKYKNSNLCLECDNFFFLKNNSCFEAEKIEKCQVFDGKASFSKCILCEPEFYLNANSCIPRDLSNAQNIEYCGVKSQILDKCEHCISGYILSSEGLKCFEEVNNCEIYTDLFKNDLFATCTRCKNGYYLKEDKTCGEGQIENCLQFKDVNKCIICNEQYYLDQTGQCKQSESIEKCSLYSGLEQNTCLKCLAETFNFKLNAVCKTFGVLPNCAVYSNLDPITCLECEPTYFLDNGLCKKLVVENCAYGTALDACRLCSSGYALLDQKCVNAFHFITSNCKETNIANQVNQITVFNTVCNYCDLNSLPLDFKNLFICVNDDKLSLFGVNTQVDNCIKYDENGLCLQCGNNKYLYTNTCIDDCPDNTVIRRIKFGVTTDPFYKILNYNLCEARTITDCRIETLDYSNFAIANLICIKCKDSATPFVSFNNNSYTNIQKDATTTPFIIDETSVIPRVTCDSTFASIANCEYYFVFLDSNNVSTKGCARCKFGFTGVITNGSISSCLNMLTIDTNPCEDRQYQNLHPTWAKLFSCHKCATSGQIPVLLMKFTSVDDVTPIRYSLYDLSQETNWNLGTHNKSIICLRNEFGSFYHENNNLNNYTLSPNCGLAVINLTSNDKLPTVNKNPVFCAACKPKYAPITSPAGSYLSNQYIVTCEEIQNCIGSEWFNACSKCNTNYAYNYKIDTNQIEYTKCIQHTTVENCYVAKEGSIGSPSICVFCKKGYNMNKDNVCELFKPSGCSSSEKFNIIEVYNKSVVRYFSYFSQNGLGCSECINTMKAVYRTSALVSCVLSSYIEENYKTIDNNYSNYIQNCIHYYSLSDGTLKCKICAEEYIINVNSDKCSKGITNCTIASNIDGQCSVCQDGFALINNYCEKGNIQNCERYNSANNNTIQICEKCKNGYWKNNQNLCNEGYIQNCDQYVFNDPKQCVTCKEKFILVHMSNYDYCYPVDEETECVEAILENNLKYGGSFECIKCKKLNQITSSNPAYIPLKTKCMPFSIVENCEEYDKFGYLSSSSFRCTKCKKEYYLNNTKNICIERTVIVSNCADYVFDKDICLECEPDYYLNQSSTECISFPKGIIGCRLYSSPTACIGCERDMYLEEGGCYKVLENFIITDCRYYLNDRECMECEDKFFLADNKCTEITAKECLTELSPEKCETCRTGYGLTPEKDGKIDCVKVVIANCLSFDQKDPYPCLVCKKGYYVLEGECKNVSEPINDCEEYESNTECRRCTSNSVLNFNRASCLKEEGYIKQIQPNCNENVVKSDLYCSVCLPGKIWSGSECVVCNKTIEQGCFVCDYKDPNVCLICAAGYYMTKDGDCINYANSPPPPPEVNRSFLFSCVFRFFFFMYFFI